MGFIWEGRTLISLLSLLFYSCTCVCNLYLFSWNPLNKCAPVSYFFLILWSYRLKVQLEKWILLFFYFDEILRPKSAFQKFVFFTHFLLSSSTNITFWWCFWYQWIAVVYISPTGYVLTYENILIEIKSNKYQPI